MLSWFLNIFMACDRMRKTHAMALNFKGFSIPAVRNSCECDPSQQGKCDEGHGLNFSSH